MVQELEFYLLTTLGMPNLMSNKHKPPLNRFLLKVLSMDYLDRWGRTYAIVVEHQEVHRIVLAKIHYRD